MNKNNNHGGINKENWILSNLDKKHKITIAMKLQVVVGIIWDFYHLFKLIIRK